MDSTASTQSEQRHPCYSHRATRIENVCRDDKQQNTRPERNSAPRSHLFRGNIYLSFILCLFIGLFSASQALAQNHGDKKCWSFSPLGGDVNTTLTYNGSLWSNNLYTYINGNLYNNFGNIQSGGWVDCTTGQPLIGEVDSNGNSVEEVEPTEDNTGSDYDEANAQNLEEIDGTLKEILNEMQPDEGQMPELESSQPVKVPINLEGILPPEPESTERTELTPLQLPFFASPTLNINQTNLGVIELTPDHTLDIGSSYNELSSEWGFKDITTFLCVFSIVIFTFYRAQTMFAH